MWLIKHCLQLINLNVSKGVLVLKTNLGRVLMTDDGGCPSTIVTCPAQCAGHSLPSSPLLPPSSSTLVWTRVSFAQWQRASGWWQQPPVVMIKGWRQVWNTVLQFLQIKDTFVQVNYCKAALNVGPTEVPRGVLGAGTIDKNSAVRQLRRERSAGDW